MQERKGLFNGPAFCNENGEVIQMSEYKEVLYAVLHEMQDQRPNLIGPDVDIEQIYGFYQSFRHGALLREQGSKV
jgi:hypothetical protein